MVPLNTHSITYSKKRMQWHRASHTGMHLFCLFFKDARLPETPPAGVDWQVVGVIEIICMCCFLNDRGAGWRDSIALNSRLLAFAGSAPIHVHTHPKHETHLRHTAKYFQAFCIAVLGNMQIQKCMAAWPISVYVCVCFSAC